MDARKLSPAHVGGRGSRIVANLFRALPVNRHFVRRRQDRCRQHRQSRNPREPTDSHDNSPNEQMIGSLTVATRCATTAFDFVKAETTLWSRPRMKAEANPVYPPIPMKMCENWHRPDPLTVVQASPTLNPIVRQLDQAASPERVRLPGGRSGAMNRSHACDAVGGYRRDAPARR